MSSFYAIIKTILLLEYDVRFDKCDFQETRIKTYAQKLEQNVTDMKKVIQSIPVPVKPVLSYQLQNLQAIIQPG